MHIILIYDIPNDRVRAKIADICLDYGLERIQYSAFSGDLRRVHQEELFAKLRKRLGKAAGKILLLPACDKDWGARLETVQAAAETPPATVAQSATKEHTHVIGQ